MKIPFSVKLGNLFFVTIFMAFFFSIFYLKMFSLTFPTALYRSVSIQTIGGDPIIPKTDFEKAVISIQSITAYMMVSGIIIITLSN
jgi:hypothetical protein